MTPVQKTIAHAMPWSGVRTWLPRPFEWFEVRDDHEWRQVRCNGVRISGGVVVVSYKTRTWMGVGSAHLSICRRVDSPTGGVS